MLETGTRAVLACRAPGDGAVRAALASLGCEIVGAAADGPSALRLIAEKRPRLAVCDAILPGADGVDLVRRARRLKLNAQPAILLLKPRGLRLPGEERLAGLGALATDAAPTPEGLGPVLETLLSRPVPLPEGKAARLDALLDALGVPEHPGRRCLAAAVALAWADRSRLNALRASLYPAAAAGEGLEPAQAERAIRHAIDAAWRSGQIEQQHQIFGDTIDARRGKPTSGEMIAQLADILRWEG